MTNTVARHIHHAAHVWQNMLAVDWNYLLQCSHAYNLRNGGTSVACRSPAPMSTIVVALSLCSRPCLTWSQASTSSVLALPTSGELSFFGSCAMFQRSQKFKYFPRAKHDAYFFLNTRCVWMNSTWYGCLMQRDNEEMSYNSGFQQHILLHHSLQQVIYRKHARKKTALTRILLYTLIFFCRKGWDIV